MKKTPTGFIATCQCGKVVGALDYQRTERREAGRTLGRWIYDGCIITPQFNSNWSATLHPCNCEGIKEESNK